MVSLFGVVSACLATPAVEAGKHQVLVEMGKMSLSSHPDPASERMSFNVILNLTSALPRKIAYCEPEKILLTLQDSKGAVCPSSELWCVYSEESDSAGNVHVRTQSWIPSFDSQWVRVQGSVPVMLSGKVECSESVVIPLKKGASVPLVLKNACWSDAGGKSGDVTTELVVETYEDDDEGQGKILKLRLQSPHPLGWRKFEIMTLAGDPILGVAHRGECSYDEVGWWWSERLKVNRVDDGSMKVYVRYASDLSKALVPVNQEVGLSGFKQVSDEAHSTK